MMTDHKEGDFNLLKDAVLMEYVRDMPARVKCATLAWRCFEVILKKRGKHENRRYNIIYYKCKKTTPCELITDEEIKNTYNCKVIGDNLKFIYGDYTDIEKIIKENSLQNYHLKNDRRNSGVPMLDIKILMQE